VQAEYGEGGYVLVVGRGLVKLVYSRGGVSTGSVRRARPRPVVEEDQGDWYSVDVMSSRSAARLREKLACLPLELLGDRPLFLAFTVPGQWRRWVGDIDRWESMRRNMVKRWVRQWGPLMGVWVREFQGSGAPHMHWYVRCPDSVSDADYQGLVRYTLVVRALVDEFGADGKEVMPRIGIQHSGRWKGQDFGGRFAEALRRHWSEVVTGGADAWPDDPSRKREAGLHYARGVNIRTVFYGDGAASEADKSRVLGYMATEMGKGSQKRAPFGFGGVRRWAGSWGRNRGFRPEVVVRPVPPEVGPHVARVLEARLREQIVRQYEPERAAEILRTRDRRVGYHGLTIIGLGEGELEILLAQAHADSDLGRVDWQSDPVEVLPEIGEEELWESL
jgi:hypothetical protein